GFEVDPKLDALCFGEGGDNLDRSTDDSEDIYRRDLELEFAGHDTRDVEQILDQLILRACIAFCGFKRVGGLIGGERATAEHVYPPQQGIERCAQFVRDGCEEFVLETVGRLGFRARSLLTPQKPGLL